LAGLFCATPSYRLTPSPAMLEPSDQFSLAGNARRGEHRSSDGAWRLIGHAKMCRQYALSMHWDRRRGSAIARFPCGVVVDVPIEACVIDPAAALPAARACHIEQSVDWPMWVDRGGLLGSHQEGRLADPSVDRSPGVDSPSRRPDVELWRSDRLIVHRDATRLLPAWCVGSASTITGSIPLYSLPRSTDSGHGAAKC
jgi:hypothetical protein